MAESQAQTGTFISLGKRFIFCRTLYGNWEGANLWQ
jgi:hypothetical protein